eukprot:TRINITY_DN55617_c0_g1_i1.p1 TRINITY_DN55617_c0_g1~~TRINITY_DN55617_c0_g1_i1.p1  ORF type:complete len:445 (+),score=85.17 TRINITY_DN55617_c0_g1_i1:100-1335(+)
MAHARCWPNRTQRAALDPQTVWSQVAALLPQLDDCAAHSAVPKSTGQWSRSYAVYTGLCGIAVAYLRLARHCRSDPAAAQDYLRKAQRVGAACLRADSRTNEVSFFCGTPGYLAVLCVAHWELGERQPAGDHLRALLGWAQVAVEQSEDELLFGRAGYIYALLWVRESIGADAADFATPLRSVAERLVLAGRRIAGHRYGDWPLMWHCFNEPYLGAAHGAVGIIAMLYKCWDVLSAESRGLVQSTMDRLLSIRYSSGNVPIILGDRRDEHVHWCHGAPGLPGLVAAAATAAGDDKGHLREAARLAGDVVWERGLLLKGNGLCHGIAGNGYTFLSLYRQTGDAAYLAKAHTFASYLFDADLQAAIARHPDPQRRVPGKPDSPCSLMEGSAGVVCFLLDLLSPEGARFPGWEL